MTILTNRVSEGFSVKSYFDDKGQQHYKPNGSCTGSEAKGYILASVLHFAALLQLASSLGSKKGLLYTPENCWPTKSKKDHPPGSSKQQGMSLSMRAHSHSFFRTKLKDLGWD